MKKLFVALRYENIVNVYIPKYKINSSANNFKGNSVNKSYSYVLDEITNKYVLIYNKNVLKFLRQFKGNLNSNNNKIVFFKIEETQNSIICGTKFFNNKRIKYFKNPELANIKELDEITVHNPELFL